MEVKNNSRVGLFIGLGVAALVGVLVLYLAATGNLKLKERHVECSKGLTGFWECRGQYDELIESTQAEIGGGLSGPTNLQYYVDLTVQVEIGTVTVTFADMYGQTTTQQVIPGQPAQFSGYLTFIPYVGSADSRVATFTMTPEGGIATNVTYTANLR